ncbi:hypothetical protein AJ79_06762 [Helicocarpus griseus UAMH5409]|uniref:Uncharacterized protein n=1 Tax=Helicocarpus griseus UAMH5409 TaxID=1447875 RepID=A0A2B7X9E8_9EURO|nr:hypothetical protein AJ79_06762 [Helicocarpus griseus UAMH5409]
MPDPQQSKSKLEIDSSLNKLPKDGLTKASDSFFTVLKNSHTNGDLRELLDSHLLQVVGDRMGNLSTIGPKHKDAIIAGITYRMLVHMVATFPKELLKDINSYT